MLTCVQMQFKGPSREIGRLLSNMINNVNLKLEISNVKADWINTLFFILKSVFYFFPVNAKYVIKHQMWHLELGVFYKSEVVVAACLRCIKLCIVWLVLDI